MSKKPTVPAAQTCTVIQFARLVDRPAQQFYQMVRNGSVPAEICTSLVKPDGTKQPLFYRDAMLAWWNARLEARAKGTVKVVTGVDQVVERMMDMFASSEDPEVKKLADAMAKVMVAFKPQV